MMPRLIEPATLRSLLLYEAENGKLLWQKRPPEMFPTMHHCLAWNTRYAGQEAFTAIDRYGYRQGRVFNTLYRAHRVIWAMHTDTWSFEFIDHINLDRSDNRLANLREASRGENNRNVHSAHGSSSRFLGVSRCKPSGKWQAYVRIAGAKKHLGYFEDEVEAARAYDTAARHHYGEFANPNFPLAGLSQ